MPSRAELIALLTAYDPVDEDERRYRTAMLDFAAVSLDPFDRRSYEPGHFTASAFVVHPDGARVLLVHHAKLGIWVQPGGHVDPGDDTLIDSAAREITEETGLTALAAVVPGLVDIDIHEFTGHGEQPAHFHYDLRFAFVARGEDLDPNTEVLEAVWATPAEVTAMGVDVSVTRPVGKLISGR